MLDDVRETLSRTPRQLSPKYFYDERGSRLFEEITRLPEYYLTRAEREILEVRSQPVIDEVRPCTIVELGAGSAEKTRLLLTALQAGTRHATYVPVDVSAAFLEATRVALAAEYPGIAVKPVVADIETAFELPAIIERPILFAFLGSTIGNFNEEGATRLLRNVRAHLRAGDALLLGTDLRKDPDVLNAAYNDSLGVTAEFNRNILRAVNVALGANFSPASFAHHAFYDEKAARIEMHLVARGDQHVFIPGVGELVLRDGESIRTELSHKYDRTSVEALARAADLRITHWFTDSADRFALSLLEPVA